MLGAGVYLALCFWTIDDKLGIDYKV
jgi:hypothetical protein